MLKNKLSKIALVVASIFLIQPYLGVVASVVTPLTPAVEISTITNQSELLQDGLTYTQVANQLSATQVEVVTTLTSEFALAQVLLKSTISESFILNRESVKITVADVAQTFTPASDIVSIPAALAIEPIPARLDETPANFILGGSGQNLNLYGIDLVINTTYTITATYDLSPTALASNVGLFTIGTIDYRGFEIPTLPTTLDVSQTTPVVTISNVVVEVPVEPEVTVPEVTVPEVSVPEVSIPEVSVPEVTVPETTVPEVSVPEVSIPEVTVPETTVPEVEVPETTTPEVTTPEEVVTPEESRFAARGVMALAVGADVTLSKTATVLPDGLIEIALQIVGNVNDLPGQEARIVIPVDVSMDNHRLADFKIFLIEFVRAVKALDVGNRISINVINYDQNISNSAGNFEKTLSTIEANINALTMGNKTQLNMAGAYKYGKTQLCNGNSLPAVKPLLGYVVNLVGSTPADSFATINSDYQALINAPTTASCQDMSAIKVYSLALLETNQDRGQIGNNAGSGTLDATEMAGLLPQLQNNISLGTTALNQAEYMSRYYENNLLMNDLTGFTNALTEMARTIVGQTYNSIALQSVLSDEIASQFKLYTTPTYSGNTKFWSLSGLTYTQNVTTTTGTTDTITANLGAIPENTGLTNPDGSAIKNTVVFKFKIEPRDTYYGTGTTDATKIPTNVVAELAYIDPVTTLDSEVSVESPLVNIPFKTGTVTVIKDVVGSDTTQAFSILLEGSDTSQSFGFDVSESLSKTMSFYMKAATTDISPNTDYSKNYVTIGNFAISEIVPQNYVNTNIEVAYDSDSVTPGLQGTYTASNQIIIDKDHQAVYIKVSNTQTNDGYWYDRDEVENMFAFNYSQQPVALLNKEIEIGA